MNRNIILSTLLLAGIGQVCTGCITARVLIWPDKKFRPEENGVDGLIALSYLALGTTAGGALGYNAPAETAEIRRDNTIRGVLGGLSLGVPLLGGMDYMLAREIAPYCFEGSVITVPGGNRGRETVMKERAILCEGTRARRNSVERSP